MIKYPLIFCDTSGCDMDELQEEEGSSRENEGEARLVMEHVQKLLQKGIPQNLIAVITPYNAQVRLCVVFLCSQATREGEQNTRVARKGEAARY